MKKTRFEHSDIEKNRKKHLGIRINCHISYIKKKCMIVVIFFLVGAQTPQITKKRSQLFPWFWNAKTASFDPPFDTWLGLNALTNADRILTVSGVGSWGS